MNDSPILSRINALNNAVVSAETSDTGKNETLEFIDTSLEKLVDYADLVLRQTVAFPIWKHRYENHERLNRMEESMYRRNRTHDAAIVAIRSLDRLCQNYGIPAIFSLPDGEPKEESVRSAAAKCIGAFLDEAYAAGTGSDRIGVGRK